MQEKLFYKISEVSRITGLEPYVLRFWESQFSSLHPRKSRGNQRIYLKKEIDLILQIKELLYHEGLTIAGARKKLALHLRPRGSGDVRRKAIHSVRKELEDILQILSGSGRSAAR